MASPAIGGDDQHLTDGEIFLLTPMRDLRRNKIKAYTKVTLQHATGTISVETDPTDFATSTLAWLQTTVSYSRANLRKSLCQIVNTIVPYGILWALMIITLQRGYPYCLTLGKYNSRLCHRYSDVHCF